MYRAAMRSMLSELIRQDGLVVVDSFEMSAPKTQDLVAKLAELKLDSVLILVDQYDNNLCLSARNLPSVDVLDLREINPVSLLRYDRVLATKAAVKGLDEQLS